MTSSKKFVLSIVAFIGAMTFGLCYYVWIYTKAFK